MADDEDVLRESAGRCAGLPSGECGTSSGRVRYVLRESAVRPAGECGEREELVELVEGAVGGIVPYRFEPYLDEQQAEPEDSDEELQGREEDARGDADDNRDDNAIPMGVQRRNNTNWCTCGQCEVMNSEVESVCCREQARVSETRAQVQGIECITEHIGFQPVCLNEYVLLTAHYQYQDQYGQALGNEWKRYSAYRQFVRWTYGHLGRDIRVPLPSCVVSKVRTAFSSENYTGYRENRA
ncbi:hypothetical protein Bbelb_312730 [Branchiostoma belcheri]|nr:hypothetical protein Bbelb_312730 [Branchiostoma belcheri]